MAQVTRSPSALPVARPGEARTIGQLLRTALEQHGGTPAYLVESPSGWNEVSWRDAASRIDALANGVLAFGIRKGDAVAILAQTRLEWVLLDYALALVGGVTAPIYANSSPRDCAHILAHSESVLIFAEDDTQAAKVDEVRAELPHLRDVLTFAELGALEARGRAHAAEHPDALASATAAVADDDLFTYIYTSGTTGPPKACMIRHRNYVDMTVAAEEVGFLEPRDVMLLYLPLAHNFGRLMHLMAARQGFTVAFCPDPLRVGDLLPVVRPTVLPSVPRVFEKVHMAVTAKFAEAHGPRKRLVDWALAVGRRASPYRARDLPLPRGLAVQHRLADALVYRKVKSRLGGRFRAGISGGAPLAQEISEFFHALDVTILEGYGLTECTTAATVNRPTNLRFGTVGLPMKDVELRIARDGEILIRSPTVFAGYLKDEEATRAVLDDAGWLHSGDVGELTEEGFLRITDRKKDLIVTAGGKNLSPQNLENGLKAHRGISQALVVGDKRPYVVALVTLENEVARADGEELVRAAVDAVNADRSRFEQIKRYAILPRDFSAAEGEVTPTLKLKRRVCEQHFAEEIQALYS